MLLLLQNSLDKTQAIWYTLYMLNKNGFDAKTIFAGPTKEQAEKMKAELAADFARYLESKAAGEAERAKNGGCYGENCHAHDCPVHKGE